MSQKFSHFDDEKQETLPSVIVEEDCASLWQFAIQKTHSEKSKLENKLELIVPIFLTVFYLVSFFCIVAFCLDYPPVYPSPTSNLSNSVWISLSQYGFIIFIIFQAESECYDGWRMANYAQGHKKRIVLFGFLQYLCGTLVEIFTFSLINRSSSILNIMSYSAGLAIFIRIDDIILGFLTKFFQTLKKKVAYEQNTFGSDKKYILYILLVIKMIYFLIAEILFHEMGEKIFL